MKQFRCGDVVPGCTSTFTGSVDEVLASVAQHARADHQLAEVSEELVLAVRSAIRPV